MFNNLRLSHFVISIAFVFLLAQSSSANITNGTFDDNLDGWTTEGAVQQWWPGVAQLAPNQFGPFPVDQFGNVEVPPNDNSSLSQVFNLDKNSQTLSFDVSMDITPGTPETDVFTAKLDGTQFYSWDSDKTETFTETLGHVWPTDVIAWQESVVENGVETYASRTVNLDVSGLPTGTHTLTFNLYNNYTDTVDTYIYIDNVNVSVVPVPGAMLLGCIGAAIVGVFRRIKSTC